MLILFRVRLANEMCQSATVPALYSPEELTDDLLTKQACTLVPAFILFGLELGEH
jgi:hypothetical protein